MSIVSRILALVSSVGADIKDLYQKYINLSVGRVVYLPVLPITVAEDTYTLYVNYTPGLLRVSHTGTLLRGAGVDYTATNGTSIVFTFELKAGDEVDVERISVDNSASPVTVGGIIYNPPLQFNIDTVTNTIEVDYNPNAVRVYHTGILLRNGEDYTATSGTEIVFTNTLQIGDEVDIERITIDSTDQPTLNEILNAVGVLGDLDTTDQSNLVAAINEVKAAAGGGGMTHDTFTVVVGRNDTPLTVSLGSQIPGAPSGTVFEVDQLGANLATGGIYKLGSGGGWTLDNALTADGMRTINVLYGTAATDYRSPGMRVYKRVSGTTTVVVNSMNTSGIQHKNGTTYARLDTLLGDLTTLNTFVKSSVVDAINDLLTIPAMSGMPVSVWDVVNSRSANATEAVVLGTQIPGAPSGVVWADGQRRLDEENGNIYTVDSSGNMGGEDFFNPHAIRLVNVMYGLNTAAATPAGLRIINEAYSGFGVQTIKQNSSGITHARGATYEPLITAIGDLATLTTTDKASLVAAINEVKGAGSGGVTHDIYTVVNARTAAVTGTSTIGSAIPGSPSGTVYAAGQLRLDATTGNIYTLQGDNTWLLTNAFSADGIRSVNVLYGSGLSTAQSPGLRVMKRVSGAVTTILAQGSSSAIYHNRATTSELLSTQIGDLSTLSGAATTSLVTAINEVWTAGNNSEKLTSKDQINGYAGLSSLGRVSKVALGDVMYNELIRAFDNDQNYDPTFVATASGTNGRPISAVHINGMDLILTNGGMSVRYRLPGGLSFTTDTVTTTVAYSKVVYLNGRAILLNAEASATVCQYATSTPNVPVWTAVTHPTLTAVKWYDAIYVGGFYFFFGSDGNISRTSDFASWTNYKVDPLTLSTGYDIWSVIYQPATTSLIIAGCSAVAGSRTGGLFAMRADVTSPGGTITWNNSTVSNGESLRHCATRVYLINNDSGLNSTIVMHLHNPDDGYTYGTRLAFSNNNGTSFSLPSGFLSKAQEDQGPYTGGVWQVVWNSQYKTYLILPQHPLAVLTTIAWANAFYIPVRTTASINIESLIKSKLNFNQHVFFVQIDSNNFVRYHLASGSFRRQSMSFTDYAQRSMATIDGRDLTAWYNGSLITKEVTLRISDGTIDAMPLNNATVSLKVINATNVVGASTYPVNMNYKWDFTATQGSVQWPVVYGSGRYYFEVEFISGTPSADTVVGIAGPTYVLGSTLSAAPKSGSNGYVGYAQTGIKMSGASANVSSLPAWNTVGDVLCVAVDIDRNAIWFRVNNGNWNNSATADPVKGTEAYIFTLEFMARCAPFITANAVSRYGVRFYRGDWTRNIPLTFGEFGEKAPSAKMIPQDVSVINTRQGQRMTFTEGLWKNKFDFEINPPNSYATTKDGNGIYTVVEIKTKDGRLAARSTLSGGTSPSYTTRTVNYYEADGTTIYGTQVYTLTYDGTSVISEVLN